MVKFQLIFDMPVSNDHLRFNVLNLSNNQFESSLWKENVVVDIHMVSRRHLLNVTLSLLLKQKTKTDISDNVGWSPDYQDPSISTLTS